MLEPEASFRTRYPHGVLTEQEGGIPNDALNWEDATHICRKHRRRERVCVDAVVRAGR
jgi:hypothetical protein